MEKITAAAIAARTKVCVLTLSAWRATKMHHNETRAENERHKTNAARVLVKLSDHASLRDLRTLHQDIYRAHRALTLPTVQDGMRLIPMGREFEHADRMRQFREQHGRLVAAFLADYEAERAAAPKRLGTLYEAGMFPKAHDMAEKFGVSVRYLACPTDGTWGEWIAESARAAELELRDRLTDCLLRVRERCGSDGALYASVFDNLRELLDLVPDLNIGNAPDIARAAKAARVIAEADVDEARDDKSARESIAKKADQILSVLGGVR